MRYHALVLMPVTNSHSTGRFFDAGAQREEIESLLRIGHIYHFLQGAELVWSILTGGENAGQPKRRNTSNQAPVPCERLASALSFATLSVTFDGLLITNTHRFEKVVFTTNYTGHGGYEGETIAVGDVVQLRELYWLENQQSLLVVKRWTVPSGLSWLIHHTDRTLSFQVVTSQAMDIRMHVYLWTVAYFGATVRRVTQAPL